MVIDHRSQALVLGQLAESGQSGAAAGRAATPAAGRENYSAGCAKILAAGFGAPIRNLRSDNDSAPPIAITIAPSQIISTSGL